MFCPHCGASIPVEKAFCGFCGAPLKPLPPPPPPGPTPAGIGRRILAVILDSILIGAVYGVAGMGIAARWGGATEAGFSLEGLAALVVIAVTLLAAFLYYWLAEGLCGATLGKGILGITVRRKDGTRCGMLPSLIRNLLRVVDGIAAYLVGFVIAMLSPLRQRLGDQAAKTIVVSRATGAAARAGLIVAWLVACTGGFAGAYLLHRGAALPGNLQVVNVALLEQEGGPPRAGRAYRPGDTVFLKYEVIGFAKDREGKIDLLLQAIARDPDGVVMYPPWEKELVQTVAAGHPVEGSFRAGLPAFVPPGTYRIELTVRDKLRDAAAEAAPGFQVDAPAAAPAAGLEVRDFGMSLSTEGPPEEVPVLEGGGTVHSRWKIFGIQARDGRVNLRVALKVTGPRGDLVLDEPKYVMVDDSFYYRPGGFHLPISSHITLPAGFAKGTYMAQYTVTDEVAQSEVQHAARFELR